MSFLGPRLFSQSSCRNTWMLLGTLCIGCMGKVSSDGSSSLVLDAGLDASAGYCAEGGCETIAPTSTVVAQVTGAQPTTSKPSNGSTGPNSTATSQGSVTTRADGGTTTTGTPSTTNNGTSNPGDDQTDTPTTPTENDAGGTGSNMDADVAPPEPIDQITFPDTAGVVNVKTFGAVGDGVTDDTQAILAAIAPEQSLSVPLADLDPRQPVRGVNRVVYFPKGTYVVSETLERRLHDRVSEHLGLGQQGRYLNGMILIGESREETVLKLAPNASGYQDPANPKSVLFFASNMREDQLGTLVDQNGELLPGKSAQDILGLANNVGKDYTGKGEAANGYENHLRNMTIDVGANPGAIAVDFLANNGGGIDNVLLRSGATGGLIGLNLARLTNGPDLVTRLEVDGFSVGINTAYHSHGVVMEHIKLLGQRDVGLRNYYHPVFVRDLFVQPLGLALEIVGAETLMTMIDVTLDGSRAANFEAVRNSGYVHLRNVSCQSGFVCPEWSESASIDGVFSPENERIADASTAWSVPVKDTPVVPFDPPEEWANVLDFGADATGQVDSTGAFLAALASGKSTVFIPYGTFVISSNLNVPEGVHRVFGAFPRVTYTRDGTEYEIDKTQGMFRGTSTTTPLVVHDLYIDNEVDGAVLFENAGRSPMLVRDITAIRNNNVILRDTAGGELFLENTTNFEYVFRGPSGVWSRQLNTEGPSTRVTVDGAPVWMLGLKTEGDCTLLQNAGGRVEVLGGFAFPNLNGPPALPAFVNSGGNLLISFQETVLEDTGYTEVVRNVESGVTSTLGRDLWPVRDGQLGITIPTYSIKLLE